MGDSDTSNWLTPFTDKPYIKCTNDIDTVQFSERCPSMVFLTRNLSFRNTSNKKKNKHDMIRNPVNIINDFSDHVVPKNIETNEPMFMPFSKEHVQKMESNKDGFFLFWNLEYVMDNAITSNELLIQSSKSNRTVSNEQVPIYDLGIAYVGNENFFKLSWDWLSCSLDNGKYEKVKRYVDRDCEQPRYIQMGSSIPRQK